MPRYRYESIKNFILNIKSYFEKTFKDISKWIQYSSEDYCQDINSPLINIWIQHNPNEYPSMFLENLQGDPAIHKEMRRARNN